METDVDVDVIDSDVINSDVIDINIQPHTALVCVPSRTSLDK